MQNYINSLEKCIEDQNWYGALFIALTLPDICAKIEYPLEKKSSAKRYINWFNKYLKKNYETSRALKPINPKLKSIADNLPPGLGGGLKKETFLTGEDFYSLRCAYLHEGSDIITEQNKRLILDKFVFVQPPNGIVIHNNLSRNTTLQLQVSELSKEIIIAVNEWLSDIRGDLSKTQQIDSFLSIQVGSNIRF